MDYNKTFAYWRMRWRTTSYRINQLWPSSTEHAITQLVINVTIAIVSIGVIVAALRPILMPMKCPACGKRNLQLRYGNRSNPPRHNYYLCKGCNARFRRMYTRPFEDASDPEFNRFFDDADTFFGDCGNRPR